MSFLREKQQLLPEAAMQYCRYGRCGSIGYGIATAYAKEGANLVITGRNEKKLAKAEGRIWKRTLALPSN